LSPFFEEPEMRNANTQKAPFLAADLIEAQLSALSVSLAAVVQSFERGDAEPHFPDCIVRRRQLRLVKTASGGNIVADKAEHPDKASTDAAPVLAATGKTPQNDCLRILVGNSLLVVGAFMKAHDMLDMRTPEFQFLGRAVDALLNGNIFRIAPGYMPVASFDGLVIDGRLDGQHLFAGGGAPGFLELGDALALLQWLLRYLRGERSYVSGGDAG
jgi:hypothetical protein